MVARSSRARRDRSFLRPPGRTPDGRLLAIAFGLTAAVLAVKLTLALALADHPLLQPVGELDAGEYWRLAQRVADGDVLLQGTSFYVSPLYIYWLALAIVIGGGSVTGVLVLQAVAGTAAVWLAALTARLWSHPSPSGRGDASVGHDGWRAAVVAGAALALTGIVALQEAVVLQSAIDGLLMAAVAYTATRALLFPSRPQWFACGLAIALLASNRPNAWLLAPVCLAAVVAWRPRVGVRADRWGAATAFGLGVVLVLAPFTVRTRVATGEWQWLPGHGGLNFYIGNHAGATGTYTVVEGIRPSIEGQRDDARRIAQEASGRTLSEGEVSSWFARRSLQWWAESPRQAAGLLAYKAWLSLHAWELPVNVSYAWFREQVLLLRLLPVGAWLLLPVGLASAALAHRLVPEDRRPAWRWFRWLLPAYLLGVSLFFVVDRYRAPALVLCAVHAGVLASGGRAALRQGRTSVLAGLVGAGVLGLAMVPLPFHLGQGDADLGMALHAIEAQRDDEALAWLARADQRHATPGVAWLRAGLAWRARGAWPQAERALKEAHRRDPEVGDVAYALAGVLLSQGKGAEAAPLLEQAERQGVRADRLRLDRALALWQADDRDGARRLLAAGVPAAGLPLLRARALASLDARQIDLAVLLMEVHREHVPGDAEIAEKLGLLRAQRGEVAAAVALLEEAARLDGTRATARFNLAIIRARQGRRDDAVALLREALQIDPTYAQAAGALRELLGTP